MRHMLKVQKIIVNIDKNQLSNLNLKFDLKILADLNLFLKSLLKKLILLTSGINYLILKI